MFLKSFIAKEMAITNVCFKFNCKVQYWAMFVTLTKAKDLYTFRQVKYFHRGLK